MHGTVQRNADLKSLMIGIDTIVRSNEHIPESFLRGAEVSENLIPYSNPLTDSKKEKDMSLPFKIFYCYTREDEGLRAQLARHLKSMEREGLIVQWYDRKISAGKDFKQEILLHIDTSDILLALISPAFMNSDYCNDIELRRALDKHIFGEIRIIPIILRPVDWRGTPLGELQALPRDGKPVTKWKPVDDGYQCVAEGIRQVVEELQAARPTFNTEISSLFGEKGLNLLNCAMNMSPMSPSVKEVYQEALEALKQAVRFDPDNISAWSGIARTLYFLKKYEEAILACERVLHIPQKKSFHDGIYEIKVYSLQHIGKTEEAQKMIDDYDQYIREKTGFILMLSPFL